MNIVAWFRLFLHDPAGKGRTPLIDSRLVGDCPRLSTAMVKQIEVVAAARQHPTPMARKLALQEFVASDGTHTFLPIGSPNHAWLERYGYDDKG